VFKAESGERLLEISAHDDEILCCTFSADDKYVATCSADKKVKVRKQRVDFFVYLFCNIVIQISVLTNLGRADS